jgi:hypothetical protein
MTRVYVKSSPHLFRRIKIALALFLTVLLSLAAVIPAPLQEAADGGRVPNPVRSAWFLLWIQELVSYGTAAIYPVLLLALCFLFLPWLPGTACSGRAEWLHREQRTVHALSIAAAITIMALTIVAMFFRGGNWAFVLPF